MSTSSRNAIRRTLNTKFGTNESKKIEAKIYSLCALIHKGFTQKYDDNFSIEEFYNRLSYEKVGQLIIYPDKKDSILTDNFEDNLFPSIYNGLKYTNKDIGAANIINARCWTDTAYSTFRESEKRDMMGQNNNMKVEKGEFKCKDKTCRSDECYHFTMQTRGCDEGGTTYVVCTKCRGMYTIT